MNNQFNRLIRKNFLEQIKIEAVGMIVPIFIDGTIVLAYGGARHDFEDVKIEGFPGNVGNGVDGCLVGSCAAYHYEKVSGTGLS